MDDILNKNWKRSFQVKKKQAPLFLKPYNVGGIFSLSLNDYASTNFAWKLNASNNAEVAARLRITENAHRRTDGLDCMYIVHHWCIEAWNINTKSQIYARYP